MLARRIEEAALNSWPALQQLLFDGWVVRFARGYTRRTNSVTPIYQSLLPLQEKIAFCEQQYQSHRLPTIFRLISFSPEAPLLEEVLAQRGYQRADLTLVLSTPLPARQVALHPAFQAGTLEEWFPFYNWCSQVNEEQQASHRAILQRIVHQPLFAFSLEQGTPVACGVGVLEYDTFGLFDIITAPTQRNKGHATALVDGMLDWARERGARRAYLQVVSTNWPALRLYRRFGFQEIYHYWYRIQSHK